MLSFLKLVWLFGHLLLVCLHLLQLSLVLLLHGFHLAGEAVREGEGSGGNRRGEKETHNTAIDERGEESREPYPSRLVHKSLIKYLGFHPCQTLFCCF